MHKQHPLSFLNLTLEYYDNSVAPPATLTKFTLDNVGELDFYNVSLVDGYNLLVLRVDYWNQIHAPPSHVLQNKHGHPTESPIAPKLSDGGTATLFDTALLESSSNNPQLAKISPYNLPLMRVCNLQEGKAFVEDHRDILNDCKVWWEPGHNIYVYLPASSNPQRPCTRIYIRFLDLGLHFPLSDFMKSILLCYDIAICNLSPAAFRLITCFEMLNQIDRVKFRALPSHNPNLKDELVNIGVCRPELIHQAMQIPTTHRNWKRLLSPERFTNCKKDSTMNHYLNYSHTRAEMGRGLKRP
ncbi:hypothetical protein DVH24_016762 [Malus domestica]|uniref:Uncharacterized protein n=1 Tax=Malus domestica TaxID=3750 RepID=A0A498HT67_MALDO|nr:hypothetical protein DVH24_016762 [Malus domestica]